MDNKIFLMKITALSEVMIEYERLHSGNEVIGRKTIYEKKKKITLVFYSRHCCCCIM